MNKKGYIEQTSTRLVRNDDQVEAVRYFKSEGCRFSGWVVRSRVDRYSYSDPISNKQDAIRALLTWDMPKTLIEVLVK
jgi:hypothetical protein